MDLGSLAAVLRPWLPLLRFLGLEFAALGLANVLGPVIGTDSVEGTIGGLDPLLHNSILLSRAVKLLLKL